jgi:hypothetical protein
MPYEDKEKKSSTGLEGVNTFPELLRTSDTSVIDRFIDCDDKEAQYWTRRIIKEEGMLVGSTSGAGLKAAVELARELGEGYRVVVIFCDNIRNYMSKQVSPDWSYDQGFINLEELTDTFTPKLVQSRAWGTERKVKEIVSNPSVELLDTATIKEAITKIQSLGQKHFLIKNKDNNVIGVLSTTSLIEKISKNLLSLDSPVSLAMI